MSKKILGVMLTLCLTATVPALADTHTQFQLMLDGINAQLAADGSNMRVGTIEWITDADSEEMGSTVFFNNRGNKQLGADWVPFDPRRTWNPSSAAITYLVDSSDGATANGLTNAQTEPAIDRAMNTWTSVPCSSGLNIVKVPDTGADPDFIDFLLGFGAPGGIFADIVHAGWVNVFPPPTLGVTFTLVFVNPATGIPTDIDNNGKLDTGIREIFYSNAFSWAINGNIDVETVALHEAGHGLSQAHFGALFQTTANGKFHFSPRAVMNAGYTGPQQSLTGTDNGGHCSNWGEWPNN